MQIKEALDEFLIQLEADGRSPHTIGQYRRHVRLLADWLRTDARTRDIEAVTHQLLARFLASTQARTRPDGAPKKATAMNALRTSLRCFFGYLHQAGSIDRNPARLIRRAVCSPPPPRALSDADEKKLLDLLDAASGEKDTRDRALFRTMLATGIRIGSAVALRVEDADLDGGVLWLRQTKRDAPEKVLVPEYACELLREWIGDRTACPLFPGAAGRPMTTRHAARRLAGWLERAGIRRVAGTHCMRHTFAMRVQARAADLQVVQSALRHRSITSTLVYARCSEERVREAIG